MRFACTVACIFGLLVQIFAAVAPTTPTSPQPIYQPQDYVPHATYPNAETYPNPAYDFLVPAGPVYPSEYINSLAPSSSSVLQYALQLALKVFAKVGLFLVGGAALLVVGGVFTTAVCSLTPICSITFNGFGGINKETMRSYMTPERIEAAASLVQDAIGKYEGIQRSASKNP